jgi:capsular polysaccharide biosynthesis protein
VTTDETWKWLRTAPLPVVLAISLMSSGGLATWLWAVDKEQDAQKASVAVAAEQAKTAAEIAKSMDAKLDKLLEIVQAVQTQQAVDKAVAEKATKTKKEKP